MKKETKKIITSKIEIKKKVGVYNIYNKSEIVYCYFIYYF